MTINADIRLRSLGSLRRALRALIGGTLALPVFLVGADVARGADVTMAGDYVCTSDCHPSDAPPSIEVDGTAARCRSDLGGIFYGKVLSATSVSCFNMVGTLSEDGKSIAWSNGGRWERR